MRNHTGSQSYEALVNMSCIVSRTIRLPRLLPIEHQSILMGNQMLYNQLNSHILSREATVTQRAVCSIMCYEKWNNNKQLNHNESLDNPQELLLLLHS